MVQGEGSSESMRMGHVYCLKPDYHCGYDRTIRSICNVHSLLFTWITLSHGYGIMEYEILLNGFGHLLGRVAQ